MSLLKVLEQNVGSFITTLESDEQHYFVSRIEYYRETLFAEYNKNHRQQKIRLGLLAEAPQVTNVKAMSESGVGELIARTAVRATVWQTIAALFRAVR
jgi:hypothetical protein